MIGTHEMVRGCFAGRVWAVGGILIRFLEGHVVFFEGTVDLIGGDMDKPKRCSLGRRSLIHITEDRFKQPKCADDVCLNKALGARDRTVNMSFCGTVNDRARFMLREHTRNKGGIANVSSNKPMTPVAFGTRQVFQVTGIGELVDVNNGLLLVFQPVEHKIGTDKSRPTCDANAHDQNKFATTPAISAIWKRICETSFAI